MEDARSRAKDAAARAGANLRSAASWLRRRAEHHLLRQRPEFWVDERVVKSCYGCEREFPGSLPGFKHHCRACGKVFCGACSSRSLHLPRTDDDVREEDVEASRVCDFCFESRRGDDATTGRRASAPAPAAVGDGGESVGGSSSSRGADSPANAAAPDRLDDGNVPPGRASILAPSPAAQLLGSAARNTGRRRTDRDTVPSSESDDDDDDDDDDEDEEEAEAEEEEGDARRAAEAPAAASLGDDEESIRPSPPPSPWRARGGRRARRGRRPPAVSDRARRAVLEALRDPTLWTRPSSSRRRVSNGRHDEPSGDELLERGPDASTVDASRAALVRRDAKNALDRSDVDAWTPRVAQLATIASTRVAPERRFAKFFKSPSPGWMHPGSYVRCKKIPGGRVDQCGVVEGCGEMFAKNVAHKRMPSVRDGNVRVVLLWGALEYQRANAAPRLSSLDTLLDQEHEHLRGAVARIHSVGADVLVVERTVARFARELLLERGVSLVINVKPSCVRRLERVTGAVAVSALDQLREECVGRCETFKVETHDDVETETMDSSSNPGATDAPSGGGTTTLMTFGRCANVGGGCCVLLRGASEEKLRVVKAAVRDVTLAEAHRRRWALWRDSTGHLIRPGIDPATAASSFRRLRISACSFCATTGHLCDAPNDASETVAPYGEGDLPLGEFLREATSPSAERERCSNPECDEPPESHVRVYYLAGGRATLRLRRIRGGSIPGGDEKDENDENDENDGKDENDEKDEKDEKDDGAIAHWTRPRARARDEDGLGALGLRVAIDSDSSALNPALDPEALEMSLGRFLETAVASDDPAYLDHAHFFATKDAVACFSFDAVAPLRVSPPKRIIAAATREAFDAADENAAENAADAEASFGSNDAMDADPAGCVARYMRASEYAVHLAAARWAAANHPAGASGGGSTSHPSSSAGGGGSGGSLSPVATSRSHSRKGSALSLGGGVGDPAVAPVVDGPDAMLLPDRSHLRHVSDAGMNPRANSSGPSARRTAVTAYYPLQFDALRKATLEDGDEGYAASLASVAKWDGGAKGGKSGSSFGKTRDDRFIVKQLSRVELNAFLDDFGPAYFKHARESLDRSNGSTCLARILGAYQVAVGEGADGEDPATIDFIVMENLFRGRDVFDPRWLTYDLKGSLRARYNVDDDGDNAGDDVDDAARDLGRVAAVLLDENLQRRLATHPILCDVESKSELDATLARDTAFLANEGVMDYSLLAGVDRASGELVVGVVDYLRLYTWDKQLESYVKFTGVLGGGVAAEPTVISPVQYRRRFRKAMARYFVVVPA